jgi:hypothetical protein
VSGPVELTAPLDKIAKKISEGHGEGRVGDHVFCVYGNMPLHFLPAIGSYIAKGAIRGSILGYDWVLVTRFASAPPTLRERAIDIVVRNATDEGPLDDAEFNYAVEQVRAMLERQG